MKSRFLSLTVLLLLFFSSCKKEFFPGIVGGWGSVANYREQEHGNYEWVPADERNYFHYSFSSDGRFSSFNDGPGGGGTYSYIRSSGDLLLNYEADVYGGTAYSTILKVEKINQDKLVIAYFSNTGILYAKTEFVKED